MKKLILLLSILFISAVCAAYMNPGIHGNIGHMQGGGADDCAGGETLGWTDVETQTGFVGDGSALVFGTFIATCNGKLDTAYVYSIDTDSSTCKLGVFLDDGDGNPDSGDTLVEKSAEINDGGGPVGWYSASFPVGNAITKNSVYWFAIYQGPSAGWRIAKDPDPAAYFTDYDGTCNGFDNAYGEITGGGDCSFPADSDDVYSVYVTLKAP